MVAAGFMPAGFSERNKSRYGGITTQRVVLQSVRFVARLSRAGASGSELMRRREACAYPNNGIMQTPVAAFTFPNRQFATVTAGFMPAECFGRK